MNICDVSVIIPNFSRTALLRRALDSVAKQTCHPAEIIVIDDCSPPEKAESIRAIVESSNRLIPTKLLVNDLNRGANFSRNRGILDAKSTYLAFLDSDDIWMPEKLRIQMAVVDAAKKRGNKPVLSATGRYRVRGDGNIIVRQFGGGLWSVERIRRSNFVGTLSSVIVEKSTARHVGGFNERLSACQDWDFFIRLADHVQFVGVPDPLCVYVDHDEERITLNNKKRLWSHIYIYQEHLKPYIEPRDMPAGFYLNIAEDYQQMGNLTKGRKFLAKARSIGKFQNNNFVQVSEAFYNLFYSILPPSSLKAQRYMRYRKAMKRMLRDPKLKAQIDQHQTLISKMIS